eukprot:Rmarinus@m.24406
MTHFAILKTAYSFYFVSLRVRRKKAPSGGNHQSPPPSPPRGGQVFCSIPRHKHHIHRSAQTYYSLDHIARALLLLYWPFCLNRSGLEYKTGFGPPYELLQSGANSGARRPRNNKARSTTCGYEIFYIVKGHVSGDLYMRCVVNIVFVTQTILFCVYLCLPEGARLCLFVVDSIAWSYCRKNKDFARRQKKFKFYFLMFSLLINIE